MEKCIWYLVCSCMVYACKYAHKSLEIQIDLLGPLCTADINYINTFDSLVLEQEFTVTYVPTFDCAFVWVVGRKEGQQWE